MDRRNPSLRLSGKRRTTAFRIPANDTALHPRNIPASGGRLPLPDPGSVPQRLKHRIELMQEPHVVLEIEPQVLHAVFEHGDTLDPHAEREPGIFLRIDSIGLKHIGIDHAAAHDLQPTRALADVAALAAAEVARHIDLGRRFGEGKVRRAHADRGVLAENLLGEVEDRLFQIGERHALVDIESLDLVEDAVCAVRNRFVAENAARADHPDRRLLPLHRPHLNRRGVGPQ